MASVPAGRQRNYHEPDTVSKPSGKPVTALPREPAGHIAGIGTAAPSGSSKALFKARVTGRLSLCGLSGLLLEHRVDVSQLLHGNEPEQRLNVLGIPEALLLSVVLHVAVTAEGLYAVGGELAGQ